MENKISSNKSFGFIFAFVFLIISGFLFYKNQFYFFMIFLFFAFALFLTAFTYPKILQIPNNIWFKFGLIINKITKPIIFFVFYFLLIVPIGLLFQILRKKNNVSNWNHYKYDTEYTDQF
jgi:hypothetical protein